MSWAVNYPPGTAPGHSLPVVVAPHRYSGNHGSTFRDQLGLDHFLAQAVERGSAPFAVASVDGGNTYWHKRSTGEDAGAMVTEEFTPLLGDRGLGISRVDLLGWSMGRYGALLLASTPGVIPAQFPLVGEGAHDESRKLSDRARRGTLGAPGYDLHKGVRMRRGAKQVSVGSYNQSLILELIRRSRDGLSRVELAQGSGLSQQTVTNVARRLLDGGLIRESGKQISGPGKPRVTLTLEADAGFAVGLHLDPTFISSVVVDMEGRVVARSRTRTPSGAHPLDTLERLRESVEAMILASGVERERFLGIGLAVPGPISVETGTVIAPPLLTDWHDVPLRDSLSKATGLPVLLEKDVTAGVVAERWFAREHERDNFLFFYYGTGIGAGVTIDGEVLRGSSGNAGDIGHIIVDPDGLVCRCGAQGCLGDSIIPPYVVALADRAGLMPEPVELADAVAVDRAFTRVAELDHEGNAAADEILAGVSLRVARGLLTLINILDLDLIVFGGPFWDRIGEGVLRRVPELIRTDRALVAQHPIEFRGSALGDDVAAIGAACLVLDDSFSPRSTALLIAD